MSATKGTPTTEAGKTAAVTPGPRGSKPGLKIGRYYTKAGANVWDSITWEKRTAAITNENGKIVFEQKDCEIPATWSLLATNVVVSKYFRGKPGSPEREYSVKQLIGRVANSMTQWGWHGGYFEAEEDREAFRDELTYILLHQHAAFNSPVWFNVGIEAKPQCSACFINAVEDSMGSILGLAKTEGMLFKHGSGTGSNLSPLRSSKEHLAGGGSASGPVSFMKGFDAFAGVIKSGGKTRRAAKMVILNAEHPDILEFIQCKELEEKKAWALIDAGYDGSFTGEAYGSVMFQNSNNSVRVTDEFMRAVIDDKEWKTRAITDGRVMDTYRARDLMKAMAESAWICGDPGIQFDTTVNNWHPCPNTARINASNPCSEYMFLDDSACNLASLNLMKFRRADDNEFDIESFRHASEIIILAQEIVVDYSSYPTAAIEKNSHAFRPLGIGYANLGALLMSRGMAYDSPEGRAYAATITALLSGNSYRMSAMVAKNHGPFSGYPKNREPFLRVIGQHRDAVNDIKREDVPAPMLAEARKVWDDTLALGQQYGYKNAQISVLAPTGTIGFMMDCDTTGVEPDISLVKYKKLVGGGMLKIVNNTVPEALERLGYSADQAKDIISYIDENETIEGAPALKDEHLTIFDCAFKPSNGVRSIHWMGHLKMMSAVQPFISGAISKTVNMPHECSVEDIMTAYTESWKLGIKALAIYRDGSKRSQPLNTSLDKLKDTSGKGHAAAGAGEGLEPRPIRRRLTDERAAITHKFSIAGHEGYLTVGMYEDGMPGEIFVTMAKEGSAVSGLVDAVATLTSITLQYGVPLEVLCKKFIHTRFEPNGFTNNPNIPMAKSVMDYIFRWLELKFVLPKEASAAAETESQVAPPFGSLEAPAKPAAKAMPKASTKSAPKAVVPFAAEGLGKATAKTKVAFQVETDAPPCPQCGDIMVRNGSCHRCVQCGTTSGCS